MNHITCHMLRAQHACSQIISRPFLWYGDYQKAKEELCGAMMEASNSDEMIFIHACMVELRHQWVARYEGPKAAHDLRMSRIRPDAVKAWREAMNCKGDG